MPVINDYSSDTHCLKCMSYEKEILELKNKLDNNEKKINLVYDRLKCPISLDFLQKPIIASDGFLYEKNKFNKLVANNDLKSPITREKIDSNFFKCKQINLLLKDLNLINNNMKELCNLKFEKILKECTYVKIFKYSKIYLEDLLYNNVSNFIERLSNNNNTNNTNNTNNNDNIIIHFIDHIANLEYAFEQQNVNIKMINLICQYSNINILRHIIDKYPKLDYDHFVKFGECDWRSIDTLCARSPNEIEMMKCMIDKCTDLEYKSNYGWKLIHRICRFGSPEIVKYLIDKGVDLEYKINDNNWKPIHFICCYQNLDCLQYIIEKEPNLNLRSKTTDGRSPMDFIQINTKIEKNECKKMCDYLLNKKSEQWNNLFK